MNSLEIIGNLTRAPETRTTQSGITVCTFTVAVNRRKQGAEAGKPEADYIRVSAWRQLGELCQQYLDKGRKVFVRGSASAHAYLAKDGTPSASLELNAERVEFLSPRGQAGAAPVPDIDEATGFMRVVDDELPF